MTCGERLEAAHKRRTWQSARMVMQPAVVGKASRPTPLVSASRYKCSSLRKVNQSQLLESTKHEGD